MGGIAATLLSACAPEKNRGSKAPFTSTPLPSNTGTPTPDSVPVMLASNFGVVGDGIADDSHALQSLLDTAAKLGATVLLDGGLNMRIANTIAVPSNTRLNGGGSTLHNATSGDSGRLLRLARVENVAINYINFDGDKNSHNDATEQRHNIVVSGSHDITLDRMHSFNAKGDGLYIGDHINGASTNVKVSNSMFDQNHRQGMSVTGVSGLTVTDCHFGSTAGTAPQAGVDIEPNSDDSIIENMDFQRCSFMNNDGGGLFIRLRRSPSVVQTAGTYTDCQFSYNSGPAGITLVRALKLNVLGGEVLENDGVGILVLSASKTYLAQVAISRNRHSGVVASTTFSTLILSNCLLDGNGVAGDTTYFGVDCDPDKGATASGLIVRETTLRNMDVGIRTSAACSHVTLSGNSYSRLRVNRQLKDSSRTRLDSDLYPSQTPKP